MFVHAQAPVLDPVVSKIRAIRETGDFQGAAETARVALSKGSLSDSEKKKLEYEIELLERIKADFSLMEDALFERLQKAVRNLTREEFNRWMMEGRFEGRRIDGTTFYPGTSVSNLFWRHPELNARRITPRDRSAVYRAMLENSRAIRKAAQKEKKPYVMGQELQVTMTVTAKPDAAPVGETIRAWLPIPRKYPFQDSFRLLESSPSPKYTADENSSIRSIYFEQPAGEKGTKFQIKYTYRTHAQRFDLDPAAVKLSKPVKEVEPFLREGEHVVFSPEIRKLANEIVGSETNPVKVARALYDWVGKHIEYSYALEYSTIPNISEYCRKNGFGDCGQQALLYITLCRVKGIPARWQSGWTLFPGAQNMHDWTEIYLEPWGWVPVDVEGGGAIQQYATAMTPEERAELVDFLFGGLDQYRLIANSAHSQTLNPPKRTYRNDDVDFQRGELESTKGNIYFDKYSYNIEWQKVK